MNSSTSNSESTPPWSSSRPVVLAGLLLAVWVGAAVLVNHLDPFPSKDPTLCGASDALGEDTRILAMGTSHVLHGINPAVLGPDAMNIALGGADYETLLLILRHRLPEMPNLRLVLLEADNLCLFNTGLDRRDYSAVYAWGLKRQDLPLSRKARYLHAVMEHPLVAPFLFSRRLTPFAWMRGPPKDWVAVGPGFQIYTGRVSAINDGADRIRAHEQTVSANSAKRNLRALEELLGLLRERDIRVVLLTVPHHDGYTSNASARWTELFERLLDVAHSRLGADMEWWNYDGNPSFTDDDFNDGHHLNGVGAENFSHLLKKRVDALDGPYRPRFGLDEQKPRTTANKTAD